MTEQSPGNLGQDPSQSAGSYLASPAERRQQVELDLGMAIDESFAANSPNAPYIVRDETTGQENLTLYVPFHDSSANVEVSKVVDSGGNRTVDMTLTTPPGASGNNSWRYTDGPTQESRLVPCDRDPDTGKLTPMIAPTPTAEKPRPIDPTSDREVATWGSYWPGNLRGGTPEKPQEPSRRRKFGKKLLEMM